MGDLARFDLSDPDARWYCGACGAAFVERPARCTACGGESFVAREEAERRAAAGREEEERLAFLVAPASPEDQERILGILDGEGIPWSCRDPAPGAVLAPPDVRPPCVFVRVEHLERARRALAAAAPNPVPVTSAPVPGPDEIPPPKPGVTLSFLRDRRALWLSRGILAWGACSLAFQAGSMAVAGEAPVAGPAGVALAIVTLLGIGLDLVFPGKGALLSLVAWCGAVATLVALGIPLVGGVLGLFAAGYCWALRRRGAGRGSPPAGGAGAGSTS